MVAPEYHAPIRSIPHSATQPNSGVRFANTGMAPNLSSASAANPSSVGSSSLEERLAKFREDLDRTFFEKYGVKAVSTVTESLTLNILMLYHIPKVSEYLILLNSMG